MTFQIKPVRPNPKRKKYLTIYIAADRYAQADWYAKQYGITTQELALQAFEYALDQLEKQKPLN